MRLIDLHEAQYSRDTKMLERYDAFFESEFVHDTQGANITPNLIADHADIIIDHNNEYLAYYDFDSNNPFDNELVTQVACPKCGRPEGSKCRGYSHDATRPHLGRFNEAGQALREGAITSREAQMAISFVKSALKKHNLPFKKLFPGYEADKFTVFIYHPALGSGENY